MLSLDSKQSEEATMSYINAEVILPETLIRQIQKYIDGVYIYIPRKPGTRHAWGQKTPGCLLSSFFIAMCHSLCYNHNDLKTGGAGMIGELVRVVVDRPLGTCHPKHKDMLYPVNYGYVPGIMAPDGAEQDAYILGVHEPVAEFVGKVIAVIHRLDDVEDKWVVAPENVTFTEEYIRKQVDFQEQYFTSEIYMREV
jgi:inorganic pyrophosphatase